MREAEHDVRFRAGREVRRVPEGWQHPRDERGKYVPLLAEQMPRLEGGYAIVAYQTTSEGTPISPAFPDTPEGRFALVRHCAEHATTFGQHRTGVEAWAAILFGAGATVRPDGTVEA
jgi:hypothetical protein